MRILAYGDSNTFGIGPMPAIDADVVLPAGARWVDVLSKALPKAQVIVEGLPGRTSVLCDPVEGAHMNGLAVLPAILGSHRPIDVLILCLGTNDFKARFAFSAQDVASGMARLVAAAQVSGHVSRILCITPPEPLEAGAFAPLFRGAAERARGLGAAMERMVAGRGCETLDAGRLFAPDPLDGIHWSVESHDVLGRAVANALQGDVP